jgi:hypothetical protein
MVSYSATSVNSATSASGLYLDSNRHGLHNIYGGRGCLAGRCSMASLLPLLLLLLR